MKSIFALFLVFAVTASQASWYWPFGSDGDDADEPRISTLMEPAAELIDEASDLAADGKVQESVEKYRKALEVIDRIELENPGRAKSPEFATIRNKRAYVNAAIDSMLLRQVKENARAVAVSDTTELEKKLAAERIAKADGEKKIVPAPKAEKPVGKGAGRSESEDAGEPAAKSAAAPVAPSRPLSRREQVIRDLARRDYAAAALGIEEMLVAKPNDASALNLRAAMESAQGDFKRAESTLDQAIMSNPRSPHAYYNMALLLLQVNPANKASAKRYYETGRAVGGPKDAELEARVR